jgi:hypothetical protein
MRLAGNKFAAGVALISIGGFAAKVISPGSARS